MLSRLLSYQLRLQSTLLLHFSSDFARNSKHFLILNFREVETSPLSSERVIQLVFEAEDESVFSIDDVDSNCEEVGS